jgi:EC042_2821-lke REase/Protein of unknown function (DUF3644)
MNSAEDTVKKLIDKSIEAFILGIEIYNKPTIRYRVEGFSFFICNAWELMLKAKLLKDGESIYYKDNPDRTLSLSDVIRKIYTDKRQPLRINLEKIIDLRNTSTHFITDDYESIYVPFFQANVLNFVQQMQRFHGKDITKYISQNFLTLTVSQNELTNDEIIGKYTPEMAKKLIDKKEEIKQLQNEYGSNDLFIPVKHQIFITRNKKEADFTVKISKDAESEVRYIHKLTNPRDKYKLSFSNVIDAVNKQLKTKKIRFKHIDGNGENKFNSYTLNIIIKFYDIKNNEKYSYEFAGQYRYSQQLVEFIVENIKQDPNLITSIKQAMENEKKRKITPGS